MLELQGWRQVNWGTATVIGMFAGMLYGGSKEAPASVSKDAEVMLKLGSTPDKHEQHRLMRDAMEKRFIWVTRGSIVGWVQSLGMFTAAFCSLQNLLAEMRGVHEVYNVVGAGSATAAAFTLIMPGSLWHARNVLMGSVLVVAFCFPIDWVHLKLVEKANEENSVVNSRLDERRETKSGSVRSRSQRQGAMELRIPQRLQ